MTDKSDKKDKYALAMIVAGCTTGVLMLCVLMVGVVSCSTIQSREQTKRVQAACENRTPAQDVPCAIAVVISGKASNQ